LTGVKKNKKKRHHAKKTVGLPLRKGGSPTFAHWGWVTGKKKTNMGRRSGNGGQGRTSKTARVSMKENTPTPTVGFVHTGARHSRRVQQKKKRGNYEGDGGPDYHKKKGGLSQVKRGGGGGVRGTLDTEIHSGNQTRTKKTREGGTKKKGTTGGNLKRKKQVTGSTMVCPVTTKGGENSKKRADPSFPRKQHYKRVGTTTGRNREVKKRDGRAWRASRGNVAAGETEKKNTETRWKQSLEKVHSELRKDLEQAFGGGKGNQNLVKR